MTVASSFPTFVRLGDPSSCGVEPAVASVALAIAGAAVLVAPWADYKREVGRRTIAITVGPLAAWLLAAFVGLRAASRNCAN